MTDLVNSLIIALRSDELLAALTGGRIDHDFDKGWTLSTTAGQQAAIAVQPDNVARPHPAVFDAQVFFIVRTFLRSDAAAIVGRLNSLFASLRGDVLNAGLDGELRIVMSEFVPGQGIAKDTDDGPWIAREEYRFITAS